MVLGINLVEPSMLRKRLEFWCGPKKLPGLAVEALGPVERQ
jgi:hypothetical protein